MPSASTAPRPTADSNPTATRPGGAPSEGTGTDAVRGGTGAGQKSAAGSALSEGAATPTDLAANALVQPEEGRSALQQALATGFKRTMGVMKAGAEALQSGSTLDQAAERFVAAFAGQPIPQARKGTPVQPEATTKKDKTSNKESELGEADKPDGKQSTIHVSGQRREERPEDTPKGVTIDNT